MLESESESYRIGIGVKISAGQNGRERHPLGDREQIEAAEVRTRSRDHAGSTYLVEIRRSGIIWAPRSNFADIDVFSAQGGL